MYSIAELIETTKEKDNGGYWLYLGDFLDYFYSNKRTTKERISLVKDPISIQEEDNLELKRRFAFTAGVVHRICNQYKVPVPLWVLDERYFLKDPMFAMDAQGDLRLVLIRESPNQFRMRNIWVTANALERA